MSIQTKRRIVPSLSAFQEKTIFSHFSGVLLALFLILVGWGVCVQPTRALAEKHSQTGMIVSTIHVLKVVPFGKVVPPASVISQTHKVLLHRLRRAGFVVKRSTHKGKTLRFVFANLTTQQKASLRDGWLLKRGILSLSPVVEGARAFAPLRKRLKAGVKGWPTSRSLQMERWRHAGVTHTTWTLSHKRKKALMRLFSQMKSRGPLRWYVETLKKGYKALLSDEHQVLQLRGIRSLKLSTWTFGPELFISLQKSDAKALKRATGRWVGKRVLLRVDDEVLSAPVIKDTIKGASMRISFLDKTSARKVSGLLGGGRLPAKVKWRLSLSRL